jgi:transposase
LIRTYLEIIDKIEENINILDREIKIRMLRLKEDLEIALSINGMGFTSASTILAEIGNYRDFQTAEQLASWCGLTPKVSQSADVLVTGSITKQGSKHIRRMLVQVAHIIARSGNSKLKKFFMRIQVKKGTKKAIVALARKLVCILYHLLENREKYLDVDASKTRKVKKFDPDINSSHVKMTEEDMINVLVNAGYIVKQKARMSV